MSNVKMVKKTNFQKKEEKEKIKWANINANVKSIKKIKWNCKKSIDQM